MVVMSSLCLNRCPTSIISFPFLCSPLLFTRRLQLMLYHCVYVQSGWFQLFFFSHPHIHCIQTVFIMRSRCPRNTSVLEINPNVCFYKLISCELVLGCLFVRGARVFFFFVKLDLLMSFVSLLYYYTILRGGNWRRRVSQDDARGRGSSETRPVRRDRHRIDIYRFTQIVRHGTDAPRSERTPITESRVPVLRGRCYS